MKFLKKSSILFILAGILTLFSDSIGISPGMPMSGVDIESNIFTNILGVVFIVLGVILLFREKNNPAIEFSKCPECKKSFTYSELKDGMCPTCNVKTIDIEKYYNKEVTKN